MKAQALPGQKAVRLERLTLCLGYHRRNESDRVYFQKTICKPRKNRPWQDGLFLAPGTGFEPAT